MTEQQEQKTYFEVDIEYTTEAKMILLGKDEEEIRSIMKTDFNDIPNLTILNISIADAELVKEAKARRAFEDTFYQKQKEQLN